MNNGTWDAANCSASQSHDCCVAQNSIFGFMYTKSYTGRAAEICATFPTTDTNRSQEAQRWDVLVESKRIEGITILDLLACPPRHPQRWWCWLRHTWSFPNHRARSRHGRSIPHPRSLCMHFAGELDGHGIAQSISPTDTSPASGVPDRVVV